MTFNGEKKRTKAIKRGGQHPEWDEEFRYTLYEDPNDALAPLPNEDGTPPPPPPKKNKTHSYQTAAEKRDRAVEQKKRLLKFRARDSTPKRRKKPKDDGGRNRPSRGRR